MTVVPVNVFVAVIDLRSLVERALGRDKELLGLRVMPEDQGRRTVVFGCELDRGGFPGQLVVNANERLDGMIHTGRSGVDYMVFGVFKVAKASRILYIFYDELAKFEHLFRTVGGLTLYLVIFIRQSSGLGCR
jgi:hypothetical protein